MHKTLTALQSPDRVACNYGKVEWVCRGVGQEGEAEECMSPEASRRITSAACSVAQQVERAVCAAVQAISPGTGKRLGPPPGGGGEGLIAVQAISPGMVDKGP